MNSYVKKVKHTLLSVIILLLIIFMTSFGEEYKPSPYGNLWNDDNLTSNIKQMYLFGITGGIVLSDIVMNTSNLLSNTPIHKELSDWKDFIWENSKVILNIMDDLYKDPANTYIDWVRICLISCHKLKGEDIEPELKWYRTIFVKNN